MNTDYPNVIFWGGKRLTQTEAIGSDLAKWEGDLGDGIILWKPNKTQWCAKVDNASYSVANDEYTALCKAAESALDYHQDRRQAILDYLYNGWD